MTTTNEIIVPNDTLEDTLNFANEHFNGDISPEVTSSRRTSDSTTEDALLLQANYNDSFDQEPSLPSVSDDLSAPLHVADGKNIPSETVNTQHSAAVK